MVQLRHYPLLMALILLGTVAELIWRRRTGRGYDLGAAGASLGVALGQMLIRPWSMMAIAAILAWLSKWAPWHLPMHDWRSWVLGFFAVEIAYYWFHRASHQVRWMWATHAVHHSARQIVLPSAIRLGWTEFFSLGWLFYAALALLGIPPLMLAALLAINLVYQYPLHTEAIGKLGPVEWIFNTPSHHRAHHSSDADYIDCNFGGMLIIWDRLFGTFRAEPDGGGLHFGLVHPMDSRNPFRIALHQWVDLAHDLRMTKGIVPRLKVAFGRPA